MDESTRFAVAVLISSHPPLGLSNHQRNRLLQHYPGSPQIFARFTLRYLLYGVSVLHLVGERDHTSSLSCLVPLVCHIDTLVGCNPFPLISPSGHPVLSSTTLFTSCQTNNPPPKGAGFNQSQQSSPHAPPTTHSILQKVCLRQSLSVLFSPDGPHQSTSV